MNNFLVPSVYDNNVDHGVIPLVDAISRAAFRRNISGHANVQLLVELQTSTVLLEVCVKCSLLRYGDQLSSIVEHGCAAGATFTPPGTFRLINEGKRNKRAIIQSLSIIK